MRADLRLSLGALADRFASPSRLASPLLEYMYTNTTLTHVDSDLREVTCDDSKHDG